MTPLGIPISRLGERGLLRKIEKWCGPKRKRNLIVGIGDDAAVVKLATKGGLVFTTDTLIEVDVKAIKPGTQSVLKSVRGLVTRGAWCKNAASPQSLSLLHGLSESGTQAFEFPQAAAG